VHNNSGQKHIGYWQGIKINIVDTPDMLIWGGSRAGAENGRWSFMVVDAFEGPMPRRNLSAQALELNLKAIVVINKIDRPTPVPMRLLTKYGMFLQLGVRRSTGFSIVYTSARRVLRL
jgi:GTP-binding protein